jgi:drug/metabolite transporter (DMT)-like permease
MAYSLVSAVIGATIYVMIQTLPNQKPAIVFSKIFLLQVIIFAPFLVKTLKENPEQILTVQSIIPYIIIAFLSLFNDPIIIKAIQTIGSHKHSLIEGFYPVIALVMLIFLGLERNSLHLWVGSALVILGIRVATAGFRL